MPTAQYIGASPDGLISCSGCGSGVLEIKCPLTLADKDPAVEHPKYITKDGSNYILNQNHLYYSQVQLQMHVCEAKFCDVFIYSKKGQILTRIYYNEQYSQELITAATAFFKHKLGPFYFEHLHSATSLHSPLPTVNDKAANSANKDSDDNCKIAIIPPNQTLSAKPGEVFVSRVFKQHETQFTPTLSPPNVTPQQKRKRGRKRRV